MHDPGEPDVIPAVQRFRQQGLKLVVVSNANGRLRYLLALEKSGAAAERTVHVGDLIRLLKNAA